MLDPKLVFVLAVSFVCSAVAKPFLAEECSYKQCHPFRPDMLNVHLVAHSHMDVGWLKTKDQYFYGANSTLARAGVQYILDSVITSLLTDETGSRRFIQVETAFLNDWSRHLKPDYVMAVISLISQGRLEFVGGGWSMNDEADTHYSAIIDQMTLGFQYLRAVGGECGVPRVAWQIDPFGHSREQASLFAQMYFDGLFVGRIDYQDKSQREKSQNMEFVWKGSDELGSKAELFTGVLPNTYSPPDGFCFDILCNDQPIMDDPLLSDNNVDERVSAFIKIAQDQAKKYRTNHIIMTMGNDFNYQNAETWFQNLDKLIKYVNAKQADGSKVNVFYSTPSCYLYALNQANVTWSTKSDDFFPYASDPHAYWTGYFTSRPTMKFYERTSNNFLQVCKQLDALALLTEKESGKVNHLREAMGIAQHHDAVTGTEKQHVMNDYAKRLAKGTEACQDVVNSAYQKLIPQDVSSEPPVQVFCNLLNISQCEITEGNKPIAVTIYNPTAQITRHFIRLPVTLSGYKVSDATGNPVASQIVPIPEGVRKIPTRTSQAKAELVFPADLPALGYSTYFVKPSNNKNVRLAQQSEVTVPDGEEDIILDNEVFKYVIDGSTGLLKYVELDNSQQVPLTQSYYYYNAHSGNDTEFQFRASGAYIFRPNGTEPVRISDRAKIEAVIRGPVVSEIHQTFDSWSTQVIRLYKGAQYAEFDWVVGPIPVHDGNGKEVISRFDTKFKSAGKFYTDANGREIQERVRNFRPTWKLDLQEPVTGNYYPVNSRIILKDTVSQLQLTILTDRSQGGSSLNDGSLELMVHRRLLYDDAFGVGEALNELDVNGDGLVARGKHYVILGPNKRNNIIHRILARNIYMSPYVSFANYDGIEANYIKEYKTEFSGLNFPLPLNVHLLTMERWFHTILKMWKVNFDEALVLRFEHYFDSHDDPQGNFSKPVTFNLKGLFKTFEITSLTEVTLGANQLLADAQRLKWRTADGQSTKQGRAQESFKVKDEDLTITLKPMEVKTFFAEFRPL